MSEFPLAGVLEATWPAAAMRRLGPFTLRDGAGGGKRVSAASLCEDRLPDADELAAAEASMAEPLFALYGDAPDFDHLLAARGYLLVDPVVVYAAPVATLSGALPPLAAFAHWPPLEIDREIWRAGGIGPARVAVMERVRGPHAAILARLDNRAAGVGFVALAGEEAMLHALEILPAVRRRGAGAAVLRAAANWAAEQGARRLSLVVTERNLAARALYDRAGMQVVGKYHYRAAAG